MKWNRNICELTAHCFDVRGNLNGFDAIGIIWVLDTESSHFCAFTQYGVAAHHHMLVDEGLVAPLLHAGVNLECFAIGSRAAKLGVDFQQRCTNDAGRFDQLAPR